MIIDHWWLWLSKSRWQGLLNCYFSPPMNRGSGVSPKDRTIQSYIIIYMHRYTARYSWIGSCHRWCVCIYIYLYLDIIVLHQNILWYMSYLCLIYIYIYIHVYHIYDIYDVFFSLRSCWLSLLGEVPLTGWYMFLFTNVWEDDQQINLMDMCCHVAVGKKTY